MARSKSANLLNKKQDLVHLMILLAIALAIGVYLIATTILISQDGTSYIIKAQRFSGDPLGSIKGPPFGYPFLIFAAHRLLVTFLGDGPSLQRWIYSAQSITLLCQLLSIVPLYFIGKLFVGSNKSFWAVLILILLPYPASFTSDVLREWPHMLFLAWGFFLLMTGIVHGRLLMFGAVGLAAGFGHIIRPECAQLVVFGTIWILIGLLKPRQQMGRPKLLYALAILLIDFAIPAAPYTIARGQILPTQIKVLISSAFVPESQEIQNPETDGGNYVYTASGIPAAIVKAIGKLISRISENLMFYYLPVMLIGIYFHFRKKHPASEIERFFVPAVVTLYIIMLIVLHYNWGYISRRHSFPLVVFTIFYIPTGLEVSAGWLANRFSRSRPASELECRRWFFILLITGTIICMPKLLSRPGAGKEGYRIAAVWLAKNTTSEDYIAVPDPRITFYALRNGITYKTKPHRKARYFVIIVKDENEVPSFARNAQKQYSVWENERNKKKKIIIYKKTS